MQNNSPPKNFCPLTNPQPYQRDRDKPRQCCGKVARFYRVRDGGFIDWFKDRISKSLILDGWSQF